MLKRAAMAIVRAVPEVAIDVSALAGASAIVYGAWLIYEPAGFIVGGLLVLAGVALLAARR
jgi:hypothetical protein